MPAELQDRFWWTWTGDAGSFGTTAQIGLPAGERIDLVENGIVVAGRWPAADPWGELQLVVRDFGTGDLIRRIPTGLRTLDTALVGSTLFWTGVLAGDPGTVVYGGLWATDVRGGAAPVEIVAPGWAYPDETCGPGLDLSPSGRTLSARSLCSGLILWTDLVSTERQEVTARLDRQWVVAIMDDTYVRADFEPTDAPTWGRGGVTGVDRETGTVLWRFPGPDEINRFTAGRWLALGASYFTHYFWRVQSRYEVVLSAFDARSGTQRLLLRQEDNEATLWASLDQSSPEHLLLTTGAGLGELIRLDRTPISVLRVEDGDLARDAFEIDPPELCFEEFCQEG